MAYAKFNLKQIISSPELQKKINNIRKIGELRLIEAIWDNVYAKYKPTDYRRTYELLHSVTSTFKVSENAFDGNIDVIIKVFCDPEKMNHKGLDDNPTYIPSLINYGFSWYEWEGEPVDYFHVRPESKFLEDFIDQLNKDLQGMMLDAVITAINSNMYR